MKPEKVSKKKGSIKRPQRVKPTDEQVAVIESCMTGANVVIEAGAGTGKTTTLELAATAMGGKGLYVAYNRSIVDNAKMRFPKSVDCKTAHQLAYEAIGHLYASRLDGYRLPYRRLIPMLGISSAIELKGGQLIPEREQVRLAMQTVAAYCRSADDTLDIHHVPETLGLDPESASFLADCIHELAIRVWADLIEPEGRIPFSHDHYLKMWSLTKPDLNVDFILFDEAQDADPLIASILMRQSTQLVAVGDSHQSIYGWRGAIDALDSWPADERLFLLQSWRFGSGVADQANQWLQVMGSEKRLAGSPYVDSVVGPVDLPDAILSRTNAEAMRQVMNAHEVGRRPFLMGGGWEMRSLAMAAIDLKAGRASSHRQLFAFRSWDEVVEYAMSEDGGSDLRPSVSLILDHGTDAILTALDGLVEDGEQDVTISTTHKVKGREWGAVTIADDFAWSTRRSNGTQMPIKRERAMLSYVAVTRAQNKLDCSALAWVAEYLK